MKYYQNKVSNEIIGVENMREVISFPTENSIRLGFKEYSYSIIYDMICPNKILGNGSSFCITHSYLLGNYKRIRKQIALKKYPEFKQYRHADIPDISTKERLSILKSQRF